MPILTNARHERFYVYTLTDPRDGEVFYVGKGCGRRAYAHEADCRRGVITNAAKHERICSIVDAGLTVHVNIVRRDLTEERALRKERALIRLIGIRRLTNVLPGSLSPAERVRLQARALIANLKPFDLWMAERPRSAFEIKVARFVQEELAHVARYGAPSDVNPVFE